MAKDEQDVQPEETEKVIPEEPKEEAPEAETPPQEEIEPEQPEEPEELPVEEEGEKVPPPMSKRKAERLAKLENLVSKLRTDKVPEVHKPSGLDYKTALDADDETISQFEADRTAAAQTGFNEGLERAKSIQFHTRLEIDSPKVEKLYDELGVDPETRRQLDTWYLTTVGYNPQNDTVSNNNLRYSDFAEGLAGISESLSRNKTETTQKNIAKQAANTGLRPDGSTAKLNFNKAPEDMTDEELSAVISRSIKK